MIAFKDAVVFLKAQAASFSASAIDFGLTILLAEVFHLWYMLATLIGTVTGGVIHFIISRGWVFGATGKNLSSQTVKYIVVWLGCLLLNISGTWLLTSAGGVHYAISKVLVSVLVGVTYSFGFQKYYVFK